MIEMMKTLYRISICVIAICLVVLTYLLSSGNMTGKEIVHGHSNGRKPTPDNTDQFIVKHIPVENQVAINDDWDKFLGNENGNKRKIEDNDEDEDGENDSDVKNGERREPAVTDTEEAEWESFLNKNPTETKKPSVKSSRGNSNNNNNKGKKGGPTSARVVKEEKDDTSKINLEKKLARIQKKKAKLKMKIILVYTGLHKHKYWLNLPENSTKGYLKRTKCKQSKCHVTYDKQLFPLADAVVFHERNMPSVDMLRHLSQPSNRNPTQRWIYFTSETPKNSATSAIPYDGFFNWTMTYRVKSDIFLPYLQYRKLDKNEKPPPVVDYAKTKNSTIAWLVGNCNFGFRMRFASLLERETKVYVGGGCRDNFEDRIPCTRYCDLNVLKPYKFYLSFENGICTDYITEKYWRYLELGLVPVVLGGANYSDPRLAIPGSFIDASQFMNVKRLADYLNYLDKNDTAYNEYFKWKQKYKIWHPPQGDWPFESYFLCEICKKLHQNLPNKVYKRLSNFWNIHTDCQMPEDDLTERFIGKGMDERNLDEEEISRNKLGKDFIPKDFDEE